MQVTGGVQWRTPEALLGTHDTAGSKRGHSSDGDIAGRKAAARKRYEVDNARRRVTGQVAKVPGQGEWTQKWTNERTANAIDTFKGDIDISSASVLHAAGRSSARLLAHNSLPQSTGAACSAQPGSRLRARVAQLRALSLPLSLFCSLLCQ